MPASVNSLVEQACKARAILADMSQSQLNRIAEAIANKGFEHAERLARAAVSETGMGRVESKIAKNILGSKIVWDSIKDIPTTGIIKRDKERGLMEIATPKGIIAAILPVTNPTATVFFKSIIALKAGNPILFSPSRRARDCSSLAVELIQEAAREAGCPEGAIGIIEGSKEEALALFAHREIGTILATGGLAMARAAYSSGNPALGVGAANVPVYVHKSANLSEAAHDIIESQGFDWGLVCASEQNLIVDASIRDGLLKELTDQGAYLCNQAETDSLSELLAVREGLHSVLGQPPETIARLAGFTVPTHTTLLLAYSRGVGPDFPISQEKLAPILGMFEAKDEADAFAICLKILNYDGLGHSAAIHAGDQDVIERFALRMPGSRILVNTPSSLGGVGQSTHLIPSLTLGCGAIGKNASSSNISVRDLIDIRRVAFGVKR